MLKNWHKLDQNYLNIKWVKKSLRKWSVDRGRKDGPRAQEHIKHIHKILCI